jgi:hypothetical protein
LLLSFSARARPPTLPALRALSDNSSLVSDSTLELIGASEPIGCGPETFHAIVSFTNHLTVGVFDGAELVMKASGRLLWMALTVLVERVYELHNRIAIERQEWR